MHTFYGIIGFVVVIGAIIAWRKYVSPSLNRGFARVTSPTSMKRSDEQLRDITVTSTAPAANLITAIHASIPTQPPGGFAHPTLYLCDASTTPAGDGVLTYGWGTQSFGNNFTVRVTVTDLNPGCRVTEQITQWKENNGLRVGVEQMEQFRQRLIVAIRGVDPGAIFS